MLIADLVHRNLTTNFYIMLNDLGNLSLSPLLYILAVSIMCLYDYYIVMKWHLLKWLHFFCSIAMLNFTRNNYGIISRWEV